MAVDMKVVTTTAGNVCVDSLLMHIVTNTACFSCLGVSQCGSRHEGCDLTARKVCVDSLLTYTATNTDCESL